MGTWWRRAKIGSDEVAGEARIDSVTEALMTITYPHHEIHDGSRYFYAELITLGNSGTREILITTTDTAKHGHFTMEISANKETVVRLFEDSDSTGGTALTPRNRNRNYPDAATISLAHTPTVTTDGTLLIIEQFGEATGPATSKAGGTTSGGRLELVLKQNTKYLLRITSASDTNDINIILDWYEHTARN